jgi:hypothetical protein
MLGHAIIGFAAVALVSTALMPDEALARGGGGHAALCRPFSSTRTDRHGVFCLGLDEFALIAAGILVG